jgi:peptidoglycan hydrolase FlgJ
VRWPINSVDPAIVAITPPSDIVLDVARAADPEKYRAAVERLARLRATAEATAPPAASFTVAVPPVNLAVETGPGVQSRRRLDAYGQFEAFVLQSFLQSMLPHKATNVYGKGSAGEFWRSMLAERMGEELARSGQVGIAQRLAAAHPAQPAAIQPAPSTVTDMGPADAATPAAPPAVVERS